MYSTGELINDPPSKSVLVSLPVCILCSQTWRCWAIPSCGCLATTHKPWPCSWHLEDDKYKHFNYDCPRKKVIFIPPKPAWRCIFASAKWVITDSGNAWWWQHQAISISDLGHHWFMEMAWCLMAPSHYLKQWWIIISHQLDTLEHIQMKIQSKQKHFYIQETHLKNWAVKLCSSTNMVLTHLSLVITTDSQTPYLVLVSIIQVMACLCLVRYHTTALIKSFFLIINIHKIDIS